MKEIEEIFVEDSIKNCRGLDENGLCVMLDSEHFHERKQYEEKSKVEG